jgi:hypothetical protein
MNSFHDHHKDSIRFHYRCFDRILLNGPIQRFSSRREASVSSTPSRQLYAVSRNVLRATA